MQTLVIILIIVLIVKTCVYIYGKLRREAMKRIIALFVTALLTACTEQTMTRNFGGNQEIELGKGQRLVELTWKDNNLWILTEPMDSDYVPKTKTFYEISEWGAWEGFIAIIESK